MCLLPQGENRPADRLGGRCGSEAGVCQIVHAEGCAAQHKEEQESKVSELINKDSTHFRCRLYE